MIGEERSAREIVAITEISLNGSSVPRVGHRRSDLYPGMSYGVLNPDSNSEGGAKVRDNRQVPFVSNLIRATPKPPIVSNTYNLPEPRSDFNILSQMHGPSRVTKIL